MVMERCDLHPMLNAATEAFEDWRHAPRRRRRHLLDAWQATLKPQADELATLITQETGKPITLAQGELARALDTLQAAAEAVAAFGEETIPYDLMEGADGCRARLVRRPRGVVMAITPFNFPVNLALHKLAPALGAGCAVVWKPCPQAPETSRRLYETFEQARCGVDAPQALLQRADVSPETAEALARDPRVAVVSFTGSERVGQHLAHILEGKPLTLELGGNAAVVLDAGIDAAWAARQLAPAAVAGAGQSCCKAQRFYIHEQVWDVFLPAFLEAIQALPCGDPMDPRTRVGPMIDAAAAARADAWLDAAVASGATVLMRGTRQERMLPPAVLTRVAAQEPLCQEEVFAPISVLEPVPSFAQGLAHAAQTRFGLRASVYSRDAAHLQQAAAALRCGGLLLNLPPTFRLDRAPFGGLGASGQGLEGPRWAMEAFTEPQLVVEGPAR